MKKLITILNILLAAGLTSSRAQDTWTQKADFGGMTREYAIGFSIDNKGYMGTGGVWDFEIGAYINYKDFWEYDPDIDVWTQKADFGGTARNGAIGFSIGNKGYVGIGISDGSVYDDAPKNKDFWEYNPDENSWTQKSDFGGTARWRATGFTLNGKGYICTGYDDGNDGWSFKKDLWEYDPATDTWTQKADFAGNGRYDAIGFSIGNKGYVGTGMEYILGGGGLFEDFWEYDPLSNTWVQKSDFSGGGRKGAIGFSIANKGYLGTGSNSDTWPFNATNDFWEYDPMVDSWTPKTDAGSKLRNFATAFVLNNKGYMGTGANYDPVEGEYSFNDFWEYTPEVSLETWTQNADVGGTGRHLGVGFSIGSKGYVGTGNGTGGGLHRDFWEYDPLTNVWTQKSDFGGNEIQGAVGFSIENKGYVGIGMGYSGFTNNFWEFDPSTNTWIQKADFEGPPRFTAVGFSIGEKGYVGNGGFKDFWEYDPIIDTWTQKSDFSGDETGGGVGFSIADKGYIGEGGITNNFWEYDPNTDTWAKKAKFGGTPRYFGAVGFSIGDKGYIGTGYAIDGLMKDFWEYDSNTDIWTQRVDFGGTERFAAVGFSIEGKGYIGTGSNTVSSLNDFWEYTPTTEPSCIIPSGLTTVNITSTSSELNWDDLATALGYVIKYNTDDGNEKAKVTYSKSNSKPISGLAPNTTYFWRVKSVCSEDPKVVSEWSEKYYFTTAPFKIGEEQSNSLTLYPNPVSQQFTLNIESGSTTNQAVSIYLLNVLGQTVYSSQEIVNGELTKVITMPGTASSGWYVVRVVMSDEVMERKLMYQK
jgi:N-acetylneuraminic acid mutarotase